MQRDAARMPALTDAAHRAVPPTAGRLDAVGMRSIEVPVRLRDPATGESVLVPATAEAVVDLHDAEARGIHMSRLYLSLQAMLAEEELSLGLLERLAQALLGSHQGLSRRTRVRVRYAQMIKRPALVSANAGWRSYPVWQQVELSPTGTRCELGAEVLYASTCPCSAALSRQAVADRVRAEFQGRAQVAPEEIARFLATEAAQVATPHAQRSRALVEAAFTAPTPEATPASLIDLAERALATAVQAAVKREDELAFARRSAAHLMFCEDAARRLAQALGEDPRLSDWRAEVAHLESLHPHDAIAIVTKGVVGGFRA